MKNPLRIFFVASFLALCVPLLAIPVDRIVVLTQPDGAVLRAHLRGDEFSHILTDLQGHALIQDSDGFYCYARYNADGSRYSTGHYATEEAPAHILASSQYIPYQALSLQAAARRRTLARIRGKQPGMIRRLSERHGPATKASPIRKHCIVLLAEFSNLAMKYTRDDFVRMITQKGYAYNGATGSVLDYFTDQFGGAYEFTFDIGPLVTLSGTQKDYGAHDGEDNDKNPAGLVEEACRKSHDLGVDFSQYDDDEDGYVDNVFVMVAGKDEADGGGEDCIWSHQWYLSASGISLSLDGKVIDNYAISTELGLNAVGNFVLAPIGTFCHEYSHTLGLVDMYDTDYEASGGVSEALWGTTGLMDHGNSNNAGNTPPGYNAIDYDMLGTGRCEALVPGTYTLEPIRDNMRYFKLETGVEGEYFLFECRAQAGWDRFIGGSGLAVYHIDKSHRNAGYSDQESRDMQAIERWFYNEVNCRPDYQCADMVEANRSSLAYVQEVFFPQSGKNAFTPETDPPFVFRDGSPSPIAITNIVQHGENISFRVSYSHEIQVPEVKNIKSEVFQDGAVIQWDADMEDFTGEAIVLWGRSGGEMTRTVVNPFQDNHFAICLEGMDPQTAYQVEIRFVNGGIEGQPVRADFTTRSRRDKIPFIFLKNVARNSDGSFVKGAALPLRVYNLENADQITWFWNGRVVRPEADGYFTVQAGGTLRVEIVRKDGSKDIISKTLIIR